MERTLPVSIAYRVGSAMRPDDTPHPTKGHDALWNPQAIIFQMIALFHGDACHKYIPTKGGILGKTATNHDKLSTANQARSKGLEGEERRGQGEGAYGGVSD